MFRRRAPVSCTNRTQAAVVGIVVVFVALTALLWGGFANVANAQDSVPAPPIHTVIDENGVNLATGLLTLTDNALSIGADDHGELSYRRFRIGATGWRDDFTGTIQNNSGCLVVSIGSDSQDCSSMAAAGATLANLGGGIYRYTRRDGSVAEFSSAFASIVPVQADIARITSLTYPNGERLTFNNVIVSHICYGPQGACIETNVVLLTSVVSNRGYQVRLYDSGTSSQTVSYAINMAVDYCDPSALSCSGVTAPVESKQALGLADAYTDTTVVSPEGVTATYVFGTGNRVSSATNGSETWTYTYSDASDLRTVNISSAGVVRRRIVSRISTSRVLTDTTDPNGLNLTITYAYDAQNRLERVTQPDGNYVDYQYDARGNVTRQRNVPKAGGSELPIVVSATYATTCDSTNFRICNRPTTRTDPRGFTTDYTYDPAHGGVLTETLPSPDGSAARPQNRYQYAARYARYLTAPGVIGEAPTPIYLLTRQSSCRLGTAETCVGTGGETVRTIGYGPDAPGVPNNLLPTSNTIAAGDSAISGLSATTTRAFDVAGNETSVDGPLPGSADTTMFRYDGARRLVGVVYPDPDAGGTVQRLAVRTTFNADSRPISVEVGTVAGLSNSDWAAFSSSELNAAVYDAQGRVIRRTLSASGSVTAVEQTSFDAAGRIDCIALRMNTAAFGSLPTSACTPATPGSAGPDRITRNLYDGAGRIVEIQSGVGTAAQQSDAKQAFTTNGFIDWVEDANGNRSDYQYDRFDRLQRLYYPAGVVGSHSANPADYEDYGYDASGNRTSVRLRSGDSDTIYFGFDRLNRRVSESGGSLLAVTYAHDNQGRITSAAFTVSGEAITADYDALGRKTSETSATGTILSTYNLAGDRTRLTHPDGQWFDYDYDVLGRVVRIRENGALSGPGQLATFSYDSLWRRTATTRGNATVTSSTFDATSRLLSLTENMAGAGQDVTLSFDRNPADQTVSRSPSNLIYAYPAAPPVGVSYTANGLNQYSSVASVSYVYDLRGNLVSDGSRSFAYDLANRLTSVGGAASMALSYDPLGRLRQTTAGGVTTQFLYDGDDLIAEYSSGALTDRYVHGAGLDEPIVWYDGASVGSSTRRWLHADELGSIIAWTDSAGLATIYAYDAYGVPANGEWSGPRFRYTGQIALPEVALYHFRSRVYDPLLGRFLQTDSIGYGGGLNLYNYLGADPVNGTDPYGTQDCRGSCPREPWTGLPDVIVTACDWMCQLRRAGDRWNDFYRSNRGWVDFVGGFVPGYDLGRCAFTSCSAVDWTIAAASALPIPLGRLGGVVKAAKGCFCVSGDTLIATSEGDRPISELEIGDFVIAADPGTGEVGPKPILNIYHPQQQATLVVTIIGEHAGATSVRTSNEHPWLTANRGWVKSQDLVLGDRLVSVDTSDVFTVAQIVPSGVVEQTFTLEVADWHTFVLGDGGFVVHNGLCQQALRAGAAVLDRNGLTRAGRALQKHGDRAGSAFPRVTGGPRALNPAAEAIVEEIITTPGLTQTQRVTRFGEQVIDVVAPDGRGLRYSRNGVLDAFLEP